MKTITLFKILWQFRTIVLFYKLPITEKRIYVKKIEFPILAKVFYNMNYVNVNYSVKGQLLIVNIYFFYKIFSLNEN